MNESDRDALRAMWQQLAKRNAWTLVVDEEAFLDQVIMELQQLDSDQTKGDPRRVAIRRTYSAILFRGFQSSQEEAVKELLQALFRLSVKAGWERSAIDDIVQETCSKILERLPNIRTPQGFLSWAIKVLFTVGREYTKQHKNMQFLTDQDEELHEAADPGNLAAEIEQNILSNVIVTLLQAALPNPLERLVMERIVLFDDHPRDVARDLGLPLARTRLAKSRALQRLRKDTQLQALLQDLLDSPDFQLFATGAEDNES